MFDKFGEFDSVEELNRAAAAQKAEGDEEALIALAVENGIDKEDAEDYMDGALEELANTSLAAIGKIKLEIAELKLDKVLKDWAEEVQSECIDSEELARAVRRKGKDLAGYIAKLADVAFTDKTVVSKKIVEKCCKELKSIVGNHDFYIGMPDKTTRKQLMRKYYLGE